MADNTGALLASLLLGQRRRTDPLDLQRSYGRSLITQGSSTAPLGSGNPLEGIARALQAGIGGLTVGLANQQEKDEEAQNIGAMQAGLAAKTPEEFATATKGLKGPNAEALLASLLQNKQTELQQGVAASRFGAAYDQGGQGNGGTSITITPRQQPPGSIPQAPNYQSGAPSGLDNNLMNIRASSAPWEGKGAPQNGFETFNTPQAGANATVGNLQAYIKENPNITVAQAIAKWAPPNENNTQGYISRVAEGSGINPGLRLADVMQNPVDTARLLEQGTMVEKGRMPAGVTPDVLVNAGQNTPQAQPSVLPQGTQTAQNGPLIPPMEDVPRPQPTPDMINRFQRQIQSGTLTPAQAAQEMEKELQAQYQSNREQRRLEYTQGLEQARITQKPIAEQAVKEHGAAQESAATARTAMNNVDQLNALLKQVGQGGPLTPSTIAVKNYAKAIGIDLGAMGIADNVAPAQAAEALANAFALQLRDPAGGGGMPGSLSNSDREFLRQMVPNLSTTPEGRDLMIDYAKRVYQRRIDTAQIANDYIRSPEFQRDPAGIYAKIASYANEHPLFDSKKDMPQGVPQQGAASAPQAQIEQLQRENPQYEYRVNPDTNKIQRRLRQ